MQRSYGPAGSMPGLFALTVLASIVAGCSGGPSNVSPTLATQAPVTPAPATQAPATPAPVAQYTAVPLDCTGCWPTYAHDYERTGFQPQQTGINTSNVANLTPLWAQPLNEQIVVSPVIDDGMAFVATGAGNVYAFNESTGTILWKQSLGGPILETPTIDHGLLFVGTHSPPSGFFALNVNTGAVVWQTSIPGDFRGPVAVADGVVYVGEAGGDPPLCDPGGVHAYQATTGTPVFFWRTDPKPNDGGAVWTPISIDGPNIVFGTGNTCSDGVANANSLIRLTRAGTQEWEVPINDSSVTDDDWGGGVLVSGGRYYAANKNGFFYSTAPSTGSVVWKTQLSPFDGQGSIGTPTTDGTVVIVPSGNLQDGHTTNPPAVNFSAFSLTGTKLWSFPFTNMQRNYAPIADGLAYLAESDQIVAVDAHSGATLWSFASSGDVEFIGAPAITPVGLFTADADGAVIVFAPATSPAAGLRSQIPVRRGPLYEPYGPIIRTRPNGGSEIRY